MNGRISKTGMIIIIAAIIQFLPVEHTMNTGKICAFCDDDICAFQPVLWPGNNPVTAGEIRADDLPKLKDYPLEELPVCTRVVISMAVNPGAPDIEKAKAINMVERNLAYITELNRLTSLDMIVLRVGERMFIRSGEKVKDEISVNLGRAKKRFESRIKKILPGVQVKYCSWGW